MTNQWSIMLSWVTSIASVAGVKPSPYPIKSRAELLSVRQQYSVYGSHEQCFLTSPATPQSNLIRWWYTNSLLWRWCLAATVGSKLICQHLNLHRAIYFLKHPSDSLDITCLSLQQAEKPKAWQAEPCLVVFALTRQSFFVCSCSEHLTCMNVLRNFYGNVLKIFGCFLHRSGVFDSLQHRKGWSITRIIGIILLITTWVNQHRHP